MTNFTCCLVGELVKVEQKKQVFVCNYQVFVLMAVVQIWCVVCGGRVGQ